jgi:hypothetical protein
VILDGKIVSADRCHEKTVSRKVREIDLWYCGKVRHEVARIERVSRLEGGPYAD